jgi:hypothetical protein
MKELDIDYDISVSNMYDITLDRGNFLVTDTEFYDINTSKLTNKKVLRSGGKQIFSMKDGTFILEIEDCGEVEYFYSNNINDLI